MGVIANIVWKEIRELLTRRILLPFVAIIVLSLFIGRAVQGERAKVATPQPVLVVTPDDASFADTIITRLTEKGFLVTRTAVSRESALVRAETEVVAAVVLSGIFMVAMVYYTGAFSDVRTGAIGDGSIGYRLGVNLTPEGMALLALTLFLSTVAALALATLLAIFAEDAKSVQAAITPIMIFSLTPYFFTMFFDVQTLSLPLKVFILALPFSYPFLVPQALIFGNYRLIIWGLVYIVLFAGLTIFIYCRATFYHRSGAHRPIPFSVPPGLHPGLCLIG